jgi:hypothetical protein
MGIDGWQKLQIRGHEKIIAEIEACGAALDEGNEEILHIAKRFFGTAAKVTHRSNKYIVFSYEFRNFPINEYLEELLVKYPTCWIKNQYSTDDGQCGMWIGRFRGEEPDIQQFTWTELTDLEEFHGEDFSNY